MGKPLLFFFPPSAVEKLAQPSARLRGSGRTAHSLAGPLGGRLLKGFVTAFFAVRLQNRRVMRAAERELLRSLWKRVAEVPDNHAQTFAGPKKNVDFTVFRG